MSFLPFFKVVSMPSLKPNAGLGLRTLRSRSELRSSAGGLPTEWLTLIESLYRGHLHFLILLIISDFSICQPPSCSHPFSAYLLLLLVLGFFVLWSPIRLSQWEEPSGNWRVGAEREIRIFASLSPCAFFTVWVTALHADSSCPRTLLMGLQNMFLLLVPSGLGWWWLLLLLVHESFTVPCWLYQPHPLH